MEHLAKNLKDIANAFLDRFVQDQLEIISSFCDADEEGETLEAEAEEE